MRRFGYREKPPESNWRLAALVVVPLAAGALLLACGQGPAPADVLRNQILAELHADVRIAPYEVGVEVEQVDPGRVVLSGTVERPEVKHLAETRARSVQGVDVVVNEIEVRGPHADTPVAEPDADAPDSPTAESPTAQETS